MYLNWTGWKKTARQGVSFLLALACVLLACWLACLLLVCVLLFVRVHLADRDVCFLEVQELAIW